MNTAATIVPKGRIQVRADVYVTPWMFHARALQSLYSALSQALTFKQHREWSKAKPGTYRASFEAALKLSRRPYVRKLAEEGLAYCIECEAIEVGGDIVADISPVEVTK